ncbi:MAG TPA: iron-containing alcohol dehydrogenase, partial [Negativicutes bacterium]|nr:iron-containing alcohol dehydrogenase [Negativicutes bacterium]
MPHTDVYTLFNVGKIVAGIDSIQAIRDFAVEYNLKTALIITDQGVWNTGLVDKPRKLLEEAGVKVEIINNTPPEPATDHVNQVYATARKMDCQAIIGIGGGSSMDVAKITAVLLTNPQSLKELLSGAKIEKAGLPTLMIPTTAGTGSEATQNAIFFVPEEESKVGIVSSKLVPNWAILDPCLTIGLPPAITASTGMDALCHAIECYISKKANPLSDTYALRAISLISRSLRKAYQNGSDIDARHDMLLAALFGGMCIASSSTTAVHALAYPLGGKFHMPHGLSNAVLLPHVMQFNLDAAEEKFKDIAVAMGIHVKGLSAKEAAEKMIENLFSLTHDLNMDIHLRDKGVTEKDLEIMVEAASKVTRLLNNNPKPMTKEDMRNIY